MWPFVIILVGFGGFNYSSGYQGLVEFVAFVNVQKHISVIKMFCFAILLCLCLFSVMFIIKFHMVLISY